MKILLFIFIISNLLLGYTKENMPFPDYVIVSDSEYCNDFPDVSGSNNYKFQTSFRYANYETRSLSSSEKFQHLTDTYDGVQCAGYKYARSDKSTSYDFYMFFESDTPGEIIEVVYRRSGSLIPLTPPCEDIPTTPTAMVVDGYNFKTNIDGLSACESIFNDNGDGVGFVFVNPSSNPDDCTMGHCYYNTPEESTTCDLPTTPISTNVDGYEFQNNYESMSLCETAFNANGDGVGFIFINPNDNTCLSGHCYYNLEATTDPTDDTGGTDDQTTGTADPVTDISELIPYVDDLEDINRDIITAINNNKTSVDNVASSIDNSQSILNNILTSLNALNDKTTTTETTSSNQDLIESNLNNLSNNGLSTNDTDLDNSLSDFEDDYSNILEDTFSNYTDVLGLGGYASAPSSISFNLLGKSYTLFDISYINPYVEHIRTIFIVFGYLFGLFIFFRSV